MSFFRADQSMAVPRCRRAGGHARRTSRQPERPAPGPLRSNDFAASPYLPPARAAEVRGRDHGYRPLLLAAPAGQRHGSGSYILNARMLDHREAGEA